MAISPNQLEESFQLEVKLYEELIDKELVKKKITRGRGQAVLVNVPMGFNTNHYYVLRTKYIDAGWTNVIYESDPRDGDSWLVFKY